MKKGLFKKIAMCFALVSIICTIFAPQYYKLITNITKYSTNKIISLSVIPHILLLISFIISVLGIIISVKNKNKIEKLYFIPVFLYAVTMVFTTPFRYVYLYKNSYYLSNSNCSEQAFNDTDLSNENNCYYDETYPESYRYDRLFVYNYVYSNEGEDESGDWNTRYIYIPIIKKIIYMNGGKFSVYNCEYHSNKKIKIGKYYYIKEKTYFTES